ncbi:MAG TPA: histidine phosphatase family protein [Thermoanaerobaculia bacterium]
MRPYLHLMLLALASVIVSVASASQATEAPQPAARTILLIRHGAYVADPANPSPGPGLSPLGVAQARLAAARIAGLTGTPDALFTSPMTRAHETAKVIAADLPGVPLEIVPDLAECTPATRRKEVTARETPEKMAECAARLDGLFNARFIPSRGTPRREILVCHGNVIRYLTTRALGVDTEAWLEMSVGHASVTEIIVEPDGRFKVISLGDTGHIPPNLLTGATGMTEKSLAVP